MHLGTNKFQVCITSILKFISVLLKVHGSRAPLNMGQLKRFLAQIFFLIIGTDWKVATTSFQTFIFWGHTNRYIFNNHLFSVSSPVSGCLCNRLCLPESHSFIHSFIQSVSQSVSQLIKINSPPGRVYFDGG